MSKKGKGKDAGPIEYTPLPANEREPEFYLSQLNEPQRRAVEHPPQGGLQILAGPGSGVYHYSYLTVTI